MINGSRLKGHVSVIETSLGGFSWCMNIEFDVIDGLMMMKRDMKECAILMGEMGLMGSVNNNAGELSKLLEGSIGNGTSIILWCVEGRVEDDELRWVLRA